MTEGHAIGRLWRGRAPAANAEAYEDHVRQATLPELEAIDGFQGVYVLRRPDGAEVEFVVLTLWASEASLRAFAGADLEAAVVPPAAQQLLRGFDERASHYEVVLREAQ